MSNKKKNGEIFWELASISPMVNSLGQITHFIAVKADITEKKSIASLLGAVLKGAMVSMVK